MRLIRPSFNIVEQLPGLDGVYKQIELAGRTCYKSEDKITEESAKKFVDTMIKSGHGAMLEHGTVYLEIPFTDSKLIRRYKDNKYSIFIETRGTSHCVTTNYRVLVENNWLDDLQYICEPTRLHEKRITVCFVCDRGVSHEFVRHRVFSFAQESTRYCNYSKDKFGDEITYILPIWMNAAQLGRHNSKLIREQCKDCCEKNGFSAEDMLEINYLDSLATAELDYFSLLKGGWAPQKARDVLPNSLKTELVMTGTISQWEGFFKLRDDVHAHPQAYELANPLHEEFIKRNLI